MVFSWLCYVVLKPEKADYIDVAMADSLIAASPNNMGTVFSERKPPVIADERALGGYAMYQIYETKDGKYVVLGGSEMHFAEAVLKKLGRSDLIEFCKPPPGRRQKPVQDFLTETFKTQDQKYWVLFFEGINAAFAPLNNLREGVDDVQIRHREMIVEDEKGWEHIGIPIKFKNEPGELKFLFAERGEHTKEILTELGYDDNLVCSLKESGVF